MAAPREEFLGGVEEWRETSTQTNAQATATRAAEVGKDHYVTGFSISASAAPAATVEAVIQQNGGAVNRRRMQIPAAAFAPIYIEFRRVLRIPEGQNVEIVLPALGATVKGTVELFGFTRNT